MNPFCLKRTAAIAIAALVALGWAPVSALADGEPETTRFTSSVTIGEGDTTYAGHNLIIDGVMVTIDGDHTFGDIQVINGGRIAHTAAAASTDAGLFITAQRVQVEAGSRINVSGRGPSAAESGFRTGGSHGGRGGRGESTSYQSNAEHGDVLAPVSQGSAGNGGRRGGGAFRLVAEELVLEGEILADGTAGTANASHGGGSGGSIWLDVDTLSGGGLVRAAGGDAGHWAGGGGGGRVAVYYGTLAFEMERVTAPGGARGAGNHPNSQHGGAGTVYLRQRDAAQGVFRLVGDESEAETAFTVYGVAPAGHVLARRVNGRVEGGMAGAPQMSVQEARLILPEYEYAFGTVTLDGAHLTMAGGMHTADTLDLVNGSVLTHTAAAASTDAGLFITAQRVQVEAGSRINVSGRGPSAAESGFRTGGSHGGRGGRGESTSYQSNAEHGDVLAPVSQGSAGNGGRRGGGAFRLVAEELVLEGEILADGTAGTANASHGGGSGGSIWLDVDTLSGGGLVRAAGGDAGHWAGGGGGGRVAVYYGTLAFEMERVTAPGGARGAGNHPNSQHGGAGTVYLRQRDAAQGVFRLVGDESEAETAFTVYGVAPAGHVLARRVNGRVEGGMAGAPHMSVQEARLILPEYEYAFGTVTLDGAHLTMAGGMHTADTLDLVNGSVLTHTAAAASTDAGLFITAQRVQVEAGSRINVSGRGPSAAESGFRTGGSHGGRGGRGESASGQSNAEHGDVLAPVSQGSAGNGGRRGGGAFRLVAEELVLEGEILADGTAGTANASHGGGSGGSIWLDVDTLSGGGLVRAAGGDAGHWAGGGGGGRVAVYYGTLAFEMERVTAPGGARGAGNHPNSQHGGAGTVYLRQRDAALGAIRIEGVRPWAETAFTVYSVPSDDLTVREVQGRLDYVAGGANLSLQGSRLTLPEYDYTFGTVTLIGNSVLTHVNAAASTDAGLFITAARVEVEAGSRIDVSGRGPSAAESGFRTGGSHGGRGGRGESASDQSNAEHGDVLAPVSQGSAGNGGRRGGGAFRLVAEELVLEGEILADGTAGTANASYGGGSGGSIWLDVDTLSGGGLVRAAGGDAGHWAGGGGGGRVAVYYGTLAFDVERVTAPGGARGAGNHPNSQHGGAGTVYVRQRDAAQGVFRLVGDESEAETAFTVYGVAPAGPLLVRRTYGRVEGLADTPGLDLQEAWLTLPANDYTFDAVTLDGAQLTMAGGLRAAGALHVINGGLLTHFTAAAADSQGLLISADLIHVDETSAINVSGRGLPVVTGTQERAGGSYGGLGGELPSRSASSTNPVFGSETAPVDFGTGGAGNSASTASRGGGALRVIANELQLVGEIRADGAAASSGGGGSGGSIWIDAGILSGSGFIHANGGNGFTGGGGGGGRVAVYYGGLTDFDLQRVSVAGGAGDNGGIDGQAGSVVTEAGRYPLQVTAFEPVGERNGPVEVMTAWFTLPLDPASITHDEVNISGPQGAVVHALTLRDGDRALDIRLASPLEMEGIYEVRIGPDIRSSSGYRMDQNGDGEPGDPVQDVFVTTFTLDTTRPAPPTVNSQAPLPEEHALTSLSVALAGSRDAGTRILVNGTPRVAFGDSDWSTTVSLTEGVNDITVTAEDLAGNHSEPVELRFVVDTTPPKIGSITPAHNTYMNTPPEAVTVGFVEEGSGLDLAASTLALRRNGGLVSGSWRIVDNHLVFSADTAFTEAVYQLDMQLVDHAGWSSGPQQVLFTVDQTPPRPPVLDPIPEATNTRWLQVRGTKEAGTGILVNGEVLAALSVQTDWTGEVELQEGANTLQFMAVDRAGNASVAVTVTVHYSNVAPGPVAVTVDPNGDGRTLSLDWSSYNEAANGGDIRDYAVFLSTTPFSDISSAAVAATLPAGVKTYAAQGLTRGQTYHIAVVATDELGNRLTGVHPVAAMPVDVEAPAEVKSLQVEGGESYLAFTWLAPLDEDLAGYRLYADGGELLAALPVGEATYRIEALDAAEAVTLRVTTHDHDDNASTGVVKTGVTHLHNPAGVEATGLHSMADVSWLPVTPANLVLRYAVYVSEQAFTDVAGMTPRLLVGADRDSARVAGLHNGVTYFVAVTAINLSGGERTAVTPVEVIPEADQDGPEISGLRFNGEPLVEGAVLTAAGTVSVEASDESGISQVRFQVNDQVLGTATGNAGTYTAAWNVPAFDDGVYTLQIAAWDVHDNRSDLQVSVVIELGAPQPPTLTVPANGHRTNDALLWVEGTAEVNTSVTLYRNGTAVLDGLAAGGNGRFSGQIELDEGENVIHATATNRGGESAPGNARTVWLDTAMPAAPAGLQAMARAGGEIRLAWSVLSMEGVTHYDIYRASDAFETPDAAQRINQQPVKTGAFTDLPDVEGRYYYRVVAVNEVGTAGHPSNQASAMADSTPPRVLRIDYEPHGPHDPFSGRIAPGRVDLRLDVSEPLLTTPFLSITPSNGVPLSVALQRVSETLYEGSFEVREHTPSGTAYAVFSGRDEVGNRGTEIDDGRTLQFDTDGPVVTDLTVTPGHPIRNDAEAPVTVAVIVTLSEEVQPGTQPELTYLLSGDGRVETAMDSLVQLDELRWRGGFTLPADAGLEQPEAMQFQFSALDDLHNRGNRLPADVFIQVYQGDLPPLDAPTGLRATAAPGGAIQLEWDAVEAAADYALYRQTPDGDALIALTRTDGTTTYTDQTSVDGEYLYAVATVREDNAQQSVGAMSSPVAVVAISQPPAAPTALDLTFLPQGMRLSWAHVHDGELPVTFNVYRSQGLQVPTVDGLEPLLTGVQELHALDAAPSENAYAYAVSAVDAAGNESALSASAFLNPGLLPVGTFEVLQDRDAKPELTWIHVSQSLDGFDLYLGADAAGHRLGGGRIAGTRYVDGGYADDERLYTIIAVDGNGLESLPRSLLLPAISAEPDAEAQLLRGIMNRLPYVVSNQGDHAASNIRLHAVIGQHGGVSEAFDLAPGQTLTVPVIFGGHDDLPNLARLTTTVDVRPNPGERSRSVREVDLIVGDAGLVLDLSTREFRRGAPGEVQFSLENTSEVDIEIITARNQGKANSGEIRFHMLDADDNVLATGGFRQFSGANVITLADGRTVARIPAGETFTSVWTGFAVPAAAPDQVRIRVQIDALHYRLGSAESVSINGPRSSRQVTVSDTSYHGNVVDIAPASSFGDQPVLIQGQALARGTDQPLGGVPLNLVIAGNGYERSHQVYADSEGMFTHTFKPLAGESGIYTVSVLHPDITDRPAHGGFTIGRVAVRPSQASLHGAVNIPQEIPIRVAAGAATDVSNVRLHIDPAAQPGGMWPEGLEADLGQPADLASGTERTLMLRLTADNRVPENGTVNVDVLSDDTGDQVLGRVRVDYRFTEAVPTLHWTPNFVETGVAHGGSVADVITLQNRGLAALEDVRVQLLTVQGAQAPAWIYLASPENQGTLDVGDERKIQLIASPGESIADGVYHFKLRIRSANHPTREANIYVAVTQSGVGSVLFRATDIYTATLDAGGNPIQGLAGARIRLQNEDVSSIEQTLTTDGNGEALFHDLPAGRYRFRATAANHEEATGRIHIRPGITVSEEIFLNYNLVTVEWSVREITIEDRYEVTLRAIFETNVPAPVLIAEPMSVNIPNLRPGDVYHGELAITNHGLVRADNLNVGLPPDDQYYRYELMGGIPDGLEAKQRIVIPYRIVMLKSHEPDGDASGGGCWSYQARGRSSCTYLCANGTEADQAISYSWFRSGGSCGGTGGTGSSGGSGGTSFIGSGGGGFGGFGGFGGGSALPDDKVGLAACRDSPDNRCQAPGNGPGAGR